MSVRVEQGRALSARVRAGSEVAPWVVPEIRALEDRIAALEGALRDAPLYYGVLDDHPAVSGPWVQWSELKKVLTPQPAKEDA